MSPQCPETRPSSTELDPVRCVLEEGHKGAHQAPMNMTVYWSTPRTEEDS